MPRRDDDEDDDLDDRPRSRDDRPRRRREEDDDREAPVGRSGSSTGTTVALIIGGVILGIFLICGGISLYIYMSVKRGVQEVQAKLSADMERMRVEGEKNRIEQEAKDAAKKEQEKNSDWGKAKVAADGIMQSVKGRRYEAIHEGATAAFQKRVSIEQLKKLIDDNAEHLDNFRAFEKDWGQEPSLTGTTYTYTNQLMTARGFKTVKVTMVMDKGEWKLDQFLVESR
jgi:outer membrane murein-binding lipoprotein Lpp